MSTSQAPVRWAAEMWIGVGFAVLTLGEAIRKATYTDDFRFASFSWVVLLNCLIVGWLMALGVLGFVGAALCGVWILFSIWRSGRR